MVASKGVRSWRDGGGWMLTTGAFSVIALATAGGGLGGCHIGRFKGMLLSWFTEK